MLNRLVPLLTAIAFTLLVRPVDGATGAVHSVCPNGCDFTRIAAAVAAASNGDEIVLAFTVPTVHTEAAIVIEKNLTLRGFGRDETIVQAAATAAAATDRIFTIQNGASVFLKSMTLRHGGGSFGGAIRVLGLTGLTSDLTLERVGVTGNVAAGNGGGLIAGSGTTVTIIDSVFEANEASDGGGIFATLADITIFDSLFVANEVDGVGGGVFASGGDLVMWNSTVTGNVALVQSGGIDARSGIPSLQHVTIVDNSAPSVGGFNFLLAGVRNSVIANNPGGDCAREVTGANQHNWDSDGSCGIGVVGSGDPELEPLRDNGGPTPTRAPQEESPLVDAADQSRCSSSDQRGIDRNLGGDCDIGAYERYELKTCETVHLAIPDDDPGGVSHTVLLNTPDGSVDRIVDVNASVFLLHDAVGDLTVDLEHDGIRVPLIDRPGVPGLLFGCPEDDVLASFDASADQPVETQCSASGFAIGGRFRPNGPLESFLRRNGSGDWTLTVTDSAAAATGTWLSWCVYVELFDGPPEAPLFADGFESGNETVWSSVVQ